MSKVCIRCERPIQKSIYNSSKYCSLKCQKLYLKSQYRKRNSEKLKAYNREYRRAKNGGNRHHRFPAELRDDKCLACGTTEDLQLAHIKPLWAGGKRKDVITLCRTHHHQFDNLLRDFWKEAIIAL